MRAAVAVVLAAVTAAAIGWSTLMFTTMRAGERPALTTWIAVAWVLFALAVLALRRVPARAVAAVVLAGSALIGAAGLLAPPNTSNDSARYAWDGIVQKAGISPYDHPPASDALDDLRPEWLFPAPTSVGSGADGEISCPGYRYDGVRSVDDGDPLCTALNRPTVLTIYPPVAEAYFVVVRLFVPPEAEYLPMQIGGLVLSLGVTAGLIAALRRRGMDARWAALWGWCPLVATDAVNNAHVDVLGAALAVLGTLLISRGHRVWGGIALGASIATKLIPVIVAPPLIRRRPVAVIVAAVLTFGAVYIPAVIASGPQVLGYLPGYLKEEGYEDGSRFALLSLVLPGSWTLPVAAVILAGVAVLCVLRTDPTRPWMTQVVLVGMTLLIVSPRYAWYALLLVPFIALSRRWEWFAVVLALSARSLIPSLTVSRVALAIAAVVLIAAWLIRRRRRASPTLAPAPGSAPTSTLEAAP
ncbi:glycosyltransferase 87 family protein [Schumannella sp. 10F1B-5-1]|uniref:glycosyltransferase 87 family protein n=1 Tax=Schumannella sp. 10F1B-5-1 TaxID=2590780 RepID=UPI001131629B|nr:glycosyltransferase 87 family protein [Schumannella sp. 10F1B-5-1]TPW72819.1 DUF2029 domain-containing protein [Schumannella sp. 10F1B-5-1]